MVKAKEYDIKINAYFDNEMGGEEEAAFMQELNSTPALREKFEEELSLRAILGGKPVKEGEQTGAPAKIIAANTKNRAVVLLNSRMVIAAAVIIAVVAVSVVFVVADKTSRPLATVPAQTSSAVDFLKKAPRKPVEAVAAADLYKNFYQPYASENDPVELGFYYQQYKKGNYAAVLTATKDDLQQMGANDNEETLRQYLQLYKGLAYLEQTNAGKAEKYFDTVLRSANNQTPQYYTAQWYATLAALRLGQVAKADSTGEIISTGASPYKTKAGELVKQLSVK